MARDGGSVAALAGLVIIGGVVAWAFFANPSSVNQVEDKINARFPNFDVYNAVDKVLGVKYPDTGIAGWLYRLQQRFGSDIMPHDVPTEINTGIPVDPLAALSAAGGPQVSYDPSSVLSADEGGSGGMS